MTAGQLQFQQVAQAHARAKDCWMKAKSQSFYTLKYVIECLCHKNCWYQLLPCRNNFRILRDRCAFRTNSHQIRVGLETIMAILEQTCQREYRFSQQLQTSGFYVQ